MDLQILGCLVADTLPGATPLQWPNWVNFMEGSGDYLAQGPQALAPRHAGGQLYALAMCCHLLSAVMTDHVLGKSCFPLYLLFIKVNKQMSTCVQL